MWVGFGRVPHFPPLPLPLSTAAAPAQHLLAAGAFTLCATHLADLSALADVYPAAKAVHFTAEAGVGAQGRRGGLDFKFELAGALRVLCGALRTGSGCAGRVWGGRKRGREDHLRSGAAACAHFRLRILPPSRAAAKAR